MADREVGIYVVINPDDGTGGTIAAWWDGSMWTLPEPGNRQFNDSEVQVKSPRRYPYMPEQFDDGYLYWLILIDSPFMWRAAMVSNGAFWVMGSGTVDVSEILSVGPRVIW
jgi:hypothetical protein